jgi:outer membrane protein OmpA-like peptidoglycan-associated protein
MFIPSRIVQLLGIMALASSVACASGREHRQQQSHATESDYRGGELEPGELEASSKEPALAYGNPPMDVRTRSTLEATGEAPEWRITAVFIDVGLAEVCGLDTAQTHFDYDSARLDGNAEATVTALADCFINGPLSGRDVVVVGHTDPRGPDHYNRELGMSRAEAVAQAMTREGLATSRIDVESEGEAEAHADPDEWPDDRRVDVRVAD